MFPLATLLHNARRRYSPLFAVIVLLQRAPVLQTVAAFAEFVLSSPATALLKSTVAPLIALGAIDTLAGATTAANNTPTGVTYSYSLATTPSHSSPYTVQAGTPISISISLVSNPTQPAPQSWAIAGPMPPGLSFGDGTNAISGLAAGTAQGINIATPTFFGTPTQPGDYKMMLQAYQFQNGQGFFSSVLTYEVIVTAGSSAPSFTTQPTSQTVVSGSAVSFSVVVAGSPAPTYQWKMNGNLIAGATTASLKIGSVLPADAGDYTCVASNANGTATSNVATLTVASAVAAPVFTIQPSSQTVVSGGTVALNAVASGTPAPSYRWLVNGTAMLGATNSTLVVHNFGAANAGSYSCVAVNSAGTATSSAVSLSLASTADVGRLVNLSCRAGVGTGGNVLIVGFVSGGAGTSGTQPVLIRATGPALIPFGVTGTLADPQLSLYTGSTLVASNSGWAGSAQITAADQAVGAFALTNSAGKDSALYFPTLASNGYSAQIAGASGDTGVALAEVYDATPGGTYTPSSPRLINLSARVQVGTGSNVLIAGFVIGGSTSKTVLVRASGPALVPFGVTGTLPDPQLTLFNGSTAIATNVGWDGNTAVSSAASSVGAFAWGDVTSKDSALLITLPPGSYSAQVAGAAGTSTDTGVALVEVYDVP